MKHIVIDGVSSQSLGIHFVNLTKNNIIFSETNTEVDDNGTIKNNTKNKRKIVTSSYEIGVYNANVHVIDAIKRWINKENVTFQPDSTINREYIAYKFYLTGKETAVNNVYLLELTVKHSGVSYSKEEKKAKRHNNLLTFINLGTEETYPIFEFTASTRLKMIGFTHPSGKAVQLGHSTGDVILQVGDVVKIDVEKMAIFRNYKRVFNIFNVSSEEFSIKPGETDISVIVDGNGKIPTNLIGLFKERYL